MRPGAPTPQAGLPDRCSCQASGSNPLTTGLIAATGAASCMHVPDQPRSDEGLAYIGPGRGDEERCHCTGFAQVSRPFKNTRADEFGKSLDFIIGMLRGEGQTQTSGPGWHGRGPYGDNQKTLVRQHPRCVQRRPRLRRARRERSGWPAQAARPCGQTPSPLPGAARHSRARASITSSAASAAAAIAGGSAVE